MPKRYLVYVTQAKDGTVERVPIPMRTVYVFIAAAVTGMFSIAGMAGSYARAITKASTVNSLRSQLAMTRDNYQHLEKKAHDKDVQAASLGSLASEVSALYGLTAGKLTHLRPGAQAGKGAAAADAAKMPVKSDLSLSDAGYYKSLDTFQALENTAMQGLQIEDTSPSLGVRGALVNFASLDNGDAGDAGGDANTPDMWPVMGPINSGFGERVDPVLGTGEGEFHKGVDIGGPDGTPVHAPAAGRVVKAGLGSGYGREIELDHGNGIVTLYAHLQGFNVVEGEHVVKGEVIGYLGHSGSRVTGPNLHYEVRVRGAAVNPHRYLRSTMAQMGSGIVGQ